MIIFSTIRIVFAYRYAQDRLLSVRENHKKATEKYDNLKEEYTNVTTPEGFEYYIRDQYRAVAEGEELVVLVPSTSQDSKKEKREVIESWWKRLLKR
jgi:hypothetical protein